MRILTYNVHGWQLPEGGSNVDHVAQVIGATQADIVGLNEVFHLQEAGGQPALDALGDRLGMRYAFGATLPADPHKHPPYGNAMLSRWPILAHAAHHLEPAVSYGKRGLFECRIQLPAGPTLTVYVTHFDHRSEQTRVQQWVAAKSWLLRDRNRLHLLLGDFNALSATDYADAMAIERLTGYQADRGWPVPAFDLVAHVLDSGYIDCFAAAGNPSAQGATFPAEAPERRIDYIFMPGAMSGTLRACAPVRTSLASAASDHLPVLAEIAV